MLESLFKGLNLFWRTSTTDYFCKLFVLVEYKGEAVKNCITSRFLLLLTEFSGMLFCKSWIPQNPHSKKVKLLDNTAYIRPGEIILNISWAQSRLTIGNDIYSRYINSNNLNRTLLSFSLLFFKKRLFFAVEFAKSRAMRVIRAIVVYVPTCPRPKSVPTSHFYVPTCQRANERANVPKTCQFFNKACQRAKTYQYFNLACQRAKRRAIFSTSLAKRCANFSIIFQKNYVFLYA